MDKIRIINDPVFGFITIDDDLIYQIVQHPLFQRLARIKQTGLSCLVYPGAQHTRFQHSIGAMHLVREALRSLSDKGHYISDAERRATMLAMLLHDVGHGPASHVMEREFVKCLSHEQITHIIMQQLNAEYFGALDMAIAIFRDEYPKRFLHQLISSQLDMDRMDYLNRDSYFSGVVEGAVAVDRIIKTLDVEADRLVISHKGVYSVEDYLISRRSMYWQVYLHKTSLAAEQMLVKIWQRARLVHCTKKPLYAPPQLAYFLTNDVDQQFFDAHHDEVIAHFTALDDYDLLSSVKAWRSAPDRVLALLCSHFTDRHLFKCITDADEQTDLDALPAYYVEHLDVDFEEARFLFSDRRIKTNIYTPATDNKILVRFADATLRPIEEVSEMFHHKATTPVAKRYISYLKIGAESPFTLEYSNNDSTNHYSIKCSSQHDK